jgi:hypothetical protein
MKSLVLAFAATIAVMPSGVLLAQSSASPLVLITEQEAKLPSEKGADSIARAGVTRGPKIVLVSPVGDVSSKAPWHLAVKFQTFSGARIDLASVRVAYLKEPPIDLTERLKSAIGPTGIDVAAAVVPPGVHNIRVDLRDSGGRAGSANFTLKVAP